MNGGRDDGTSRSGAGAFLGRWSARKRGADGAERTSVATDVEPPADASEAAIVPGTEPSAEAPAAGAALAPLPAEAPDGVPGPAPDSAPDSAPDALADAPDDPADGSSVRVLTDVDMPPVGSLDASSDLSVFFSHGVSATLRRAALRHVFSRPAYNVRDGLNDYDGDYTAFEPLGDTVTSDMKFHAARRERARLERERLALEEHSRDAESAIGDDRAAPEDVSAETSDEAAEADEAASANERTAATHVSAETSDETIEVGDEARVARVSAETSGAAREASPTETDEDEDAIADASAEPPVRDPAGARARG